MTVRQGGEGFAAYDATHLAVIGILLVGTVAAVAWGRRQRREASARRTGRLFAVVVLAGVVPLQLLVVRRTGFDASGQLPVQLCDLAVFVAAYALWRESRWAVALTYYWGLTLIPQALLTPDLGRGFPDRVFLLFWSMHLLVFWAAVYLTWGRRHRPDWGGYRIAVAVTAGWLAGVSALNAVLDSNYGYVARKPTTPSILDYLGPWPVYVLAEAVIIVVAWALVTWPWARGRLTTARPAR